MDFFTSVRWKRQISKPVRLLAGVSLWTALGPVFIGWCKVADLRAIEVEPRQGSEVLAR